MDKEMEAPQNARERSMEMWPTRAQALQPEAGESLSQSLARQLETWIREKGLPPGSRLPAERTMVAEWGVSRSVVREAVRSLAEKGYVRSQPGLGTFIVELTASSVTAPLSRLLQQHNAQWRHLVEAREMLELRTVRLAARRAGDEHLRALRRTLIQMETSNSEPEDFITLDQQFHRSLAEASGNPLLLIFHDNLSELTQQMRRLTATRTRNRHNAVHLHRMIFEAVAEGDEETAVAYMARHLQQVLRDLAETGGQM